MKIFEFKIPGDGGASQHMGGGFKAKAVRPMSGRPSQTNLAKESQLPASRAPGGGFFGGFGKTSKNKKATLSKEAQEEKDQRLK